MLILLWHEIQGCLYGSKVLLFGHINLHKKPHFGNRKYNWGTLPRVRQVFLNVAMYQEIGVKPHYCINIGFQDYFGWNILSCSLISLFHSMLAAYTILVLILYGNRGTRLHGFWQHCMAGWKFYFFIQCPTKNLTGCWVECRAAISALVSASFHSKESITLYFFWREGPYRYICKDSDQTLLKRHCLNWLSFFLCNVAWSFLDNIALDEDCISR